MIRRLLAVLIATTFGLAFGDTQPGATGDKAKGDQILREMSTAIASKKTSVSSFPSYHTFMP
jgi:hypothetical protein